MTLWGPIFIRFPFVLSLSLSLPLIPFFVENQFEIYNSTGLELPFGKTIEKKIKLEILYTFFLNTVILSN